MSIAEQEARFIRLVMAVVEETATAEELSDFRELLRAHPEFKLQYLEQMSIHGLMCYRRENSLGGSCFQLRGERAKRGGALACASGKRSWGRWWRIVAAAAAALLVGVSVWQAVWNPSPVVTVRTSRYGQWVDGREVVVGEALHAGVWVLQNGLIELVTRADTVLLVQAPARLEIVDAMNARLLSGKLVVRMPKGRSGFVVDAPEMKVIDLGTEFGVSVSASGESQVQVFDGKVRAETAGNAARKVLRAGETVRADGKGGLVAEAYDEGRFIRRFPPVLNPELPSGVLYSRSGVETVSVAYADRPVVADGELGEWSRGRSFRSACVAPYAAAYWLEGMMMYDATNLYLAAHVGDPDPLRNSASQGFEFAGGSVIVRVSADKAQGWPLKATLYVDGVYDPLNERIGDKARSDRISNMIMWYDAQAGRARLKVIRGLDRQECRVEPTGWTGAFRKAADGRGYTLEYVIPWRLLNCADDPPRGGDTLAALWMAHWSDGEGRIARGQLVDVTNHQPHPRDTIPPHSYYQNGPSWGRAVYLPKGE